MQQTRTVYSPGWLPIPTTYWRVERVSRLTMRTVNYIRVPGAMVAREMDIAQSIHHHEPGNIARRIAQRRWPEWALCVTLSTIQAWRRWRRTHQ